jgi:hypothetical protein
MQKAGGIIALIAGIFGVIAAFVTLFIGGVGGAFKAAGASTVVGLGWGGVAFSFLCIVFGAVAIGAKSKAPGILLMCCAVAGAIFGGTFVAVFMTLAFVGGIIATVGAKAEGSAVGNPGMAGAPRSWGVDQEDGSVDADAMIARHLQRQKTEIAAAPRASASAPAAGFGRRR